MSTYDELITALVQIEDTDRPVEVEIRKGHYQIASPIVLRRPDTALVGTAAGGVILDGGGMLAGVSHIFRVEASDIRLENLTLGWVSNHVVQIHGEKTLIALL